MQLGMIGLGRMGANLVRRLQRDGHDCVVYDIDPDATRELAAEGFTPARSLKDLASELATPRAVWVMVPAAHAGAVITDLASHLEPGDAVIDGGNSHYAGALELTAQLEPSGVDFVDIGTSGGVHGLERGYCLMIGGPDRAVGRLAPIFDTLAPGVTTAPRTPGRHGDPTPAERGWLHCGPAGAGHFVKMVHNGIEYGIMAAYAEGLNVLRNAGSGRSDRPRDAETAPLDDPDRYQYDLDLAAVSEVWRRGSVIGSWLLDLTAAALANDAELGDFAGRVSDSGEGRWTIQSAIDLGVPVPVLSSALYSRFGSQGSQQFADKVLSAMRHQFGGHVELPHDTEPRS